MKSINVTTTFEKLTLSWALLFSKQVFAHCLREFIAFVRKSVESQS